jgi:hypothetical protein
MADATLPDVAHVRHELELPVTAYNQSLRAVIRRHIIPTLLTLEFVLFPSCRHLTARRSSAIIWAR